MPALLRATIVGAIGLVGILASPPAGAWPSPEEPPPAVPPPSPETQRRVELQELVFPRVPPARLLEHPLRISWLDMEDVRRMLDRLNQSSELGQVTPDGIAVAPHLLQRVLDLDPATVLQFRFNTQSGRLFLRFTWP